MDVALLTAIISLVVGVAGAIISVLGLQNERRLRQAELAVSSAQQQLQIEQKVREVSFDVQTEFLKQKVQQRFEAYVNVFELLGAVPDIDISGQIHEKLRTNRDILLQIADQLYHHLYSKAGLLMNMELRSNLLNVCTVCYRFSENQANFSEVVFAFFEARRLLRAELQIDDLGMIEIELDKLRGKLDLPKRD